MSKLTKLLVAFSLGRFILLISLPLQSLRGYGDYTHFYNLATLGQPFKDIWVEFPPIFPFISRLLYGLSNQRQHVYDYLLYFLLTFFQGVALLLFYKLAKRLHPSADADNRYEIYAFISFILPYTWWYFDPIAVTFMLLGLYWFFNERSFHGSAAIVLGILTKLFPGLILPVVLRTKKLYQRVIIISVVVIGILFVYGGLYLRSNEYTIASIRSQMSKGSWETNWALIDGNLGTGNFGPEIERFDPKNAYQLIGNPPQIAPLAILPIFLLFGGWLLFKYPPRTERDTISFSGLTWIVFLLWSPGYSPQWVLYLLPLILLSLPYRIAVQFSLVHILLNLLEWPVILSRGYNWGLWGTILIRLFLWVLLGYQFWHLIQTSRQEDR